MLQDLGSANGTRLNGEKLGEPEVLREGDYITLGQVTLLFSALNVASGEVTAQTTLSEVEARRADARTATSLVVGTGRRRIAGGKRRLVAIAIVLLVAGGLAAYLGLRGRTQLVLLDQSDRPLVYSDDDEFFNAVFGNGEYDKSRVDHVIIELDYLGGRATLQYGAWGVDKVGEVAILLNGKPVGQVPVTMNRWVYGLKLLLPRELLKKGETNRLVFDNTMNPPARDPWEICYVQILQEAIPPANPGEARHQFELAKKTWEDREIEPGNMYGALTGFKKARDLLELLPERPELYQEALDYIDKVDQALTRKFADGLFSARRAHKLDGDVHKARNLLLATRAYFLKEDFRYREIQRQLDALAVPTDE